MKLLHASTPQNFGGLEEKNSSWENAKIVVFPVPFDSTACSMPGQRFGPEAIIDSSGGLELYDEEIDYNVSENCIFTLEELEPCRADVVENNKRIKQVALDVLEAEKFLVTLGGDHSISYGVLQAFKEKATRPFSILQIDAHADTTDEAEGSKFTHACVMRRAREEITDNLVQVGLQSVSKEEIDFNKENVFLAIDLQKNFEQKIDEIISKLKHEDVYLTFDFDALDVGIMPAVGTPEPGGLGWYQATALLRALCEKKNVIGVDFVELMPLPGNDAPNAVAAKLVYKLLGYKFKFKKW